MSNTIEKENILLKVETSDWEDALRKSGQLLVDTGYITSAYIEATIENVKEFGPYIVLAPGIALSHSKPGDYILKNGLSLITLAEPINFNSDNDPVEIVITLAASDEESHVVKLTTLFEILSDEEKYNIIVNATSADEILNLL